MDALATEYTNIPIVTRIYCTICFLTSLAVQLDIATPFHLYYNPQLVVYNYQLWRVATSFTYFDSFGFNFFFHMLFTYRYCRMLEESSFYNRTADFVFMILFCGSVMLIGGAFLNVMFFGQAFNIMMVYLWCRRNPYMHMDFLGLLIFQAPYLPWVLLAISFLLGSSIAVNLIGIGAGHLYFFLEDVFPRLRHGFKVLRTPNFIRALFDEPSEAQDFEPLPRDNAAAAAALNWNL